MLPRKSVEEKSESMKTHEVRVYPSKEKLEREQQLAWKLAEISSDPAPVDADVSEMIGNRIIDNASVAIASVNRLPVANARSQALCHDRKNGAFVFGLKDASVSAEWAAWANGVAVRELDFHDTYLAADYSHPADNIPPILAVAQQCGIGGKKIIEALATAYEIHMSLVKGICLHKHKIDHIAHLCPAVAGGLGTLLSLSTETIYQAIQQAVHVSFTTRQSRKGEISSWKAHAPAHAGKLGIEAVDRAMRGETSPSPIYEGEDSVIAWMLDGKEARYEITLPERGEPKRMIMDSYTKAHSAEYQSQALIDLAFKMRQSIKNFDDIEKVIIHTSHHTHYVIGTGANDPQKMDPKATRETLDHSIMYIFAVALEDGVWHHVDSYTPERAQRASTVKLWHKVSTVEDSKWTELYHHPDPMKRCFGGRVEIVLRFGETIVDELGVADAHPAGRAPYQRPDYEKKFTTLVSPYVTETHQQSFLQAVANLDSLSASDLHLLNPEVTLVDMIYREKDTRGIF